MNEHFVAKQLVGGMPDLQRRLAWAIEDFRFKATRAVGRFRAGQMTLAEFQTWGRDAIKDSLYMIAEIGKGERLTRKEMARIRKVWREQVEYWDRFAQNIADQYKDLQQRGLKGKELDEAYDALHAKFDRRAQSYGGAIEAEGQKWALAAQFEDGQAFRWTMTPAEHCETCIGRDGQIHVMKSGRLPFYPRDGSTICLYNCLCRWRPVGKVRALAGRFARWLGEKFGKAEEIDWEEIEKHYGPGPHPGTGTPQSVHGGKGKRSKIANKKLSVPKDDDDYTGIGEGLRIGKWLGKSSPRSWSGATDEERANLKAKVARDLSEATGIAEEDCARFVEQWAQSSNDDDMRSLAIQQDAAKEFGIELSEFTQSKIGKIEQRREKMISRWKEAGHSEEDIAELLAETPKFNSLMESEQQRKLLRATYDKTQAELKARGIKEVRLYRGVGLDREPDPEWGKLSGIDPEEIDFRGWKALEGATVPISTNAMESWSIDKGVGNAFASGAYGTGITFEATVPIERILSLPTTGQGCLAEGEVITLGGIGGDMARIASIIS